MVTGAERGVTARWIVGSFWRNENLLQLGWRYSCGQHHRSGQIRENQRGKLRIRVFSQNYQETTARQAPECAEVRLGGTSVCW